MDVQVTEGQVCSGDLDANSNACNIHMNYNNCTNNGGGNGDCEWGVLLTATPVENLYGYADIEVQVSDPGELTNTATFRIYVGSVDDLPMVIFDESFTLN